MAPHSQYIELIRGHGRFLAFGFLMAFASSAGQTYFVGIFGPEIRLTFDLNHTQWGSIYLVGTLASALCLPWSGQLIDRLDLRLFSAIAMLGLALACFSIGSAQTVLMLTFSIFLLRQFGQGLTSHAAITSMARYMTRNRGKSIAIASMGYSTGEALLPVIAVGAILALGWRSAYMATAVGVVVLIPLALWILKTHNLRHQGFLDEQQKSENQGGGLISKTRNEMLKESRFYLVLPAIMAPSYIGTGLFFHHLTLAEFKGWSDIWVTGNYWVYALFTVLTSLAAGPLIDRFSAAKILPYYLVPLIVGLLLLIPAENSLWVLPYMMLIGINTGLHFTGVSALWAELYGPKHLGGIKSAVGAINVFASALGPVSIGVILDLGYSFNTVCLFFSCFCLITTLMLIRGLKQFSRV